MMAADPRDVDAWTRAIAQARASDPRRDEQITAKLASDGFAETGRFAAYCMQGDTLRLRPWASPPCALLEEPDVIIARGDTGMPRGDYAAAVLLKRMRNAGLSDWEPDPMTALREAEAARKPAA
jgi:hypothetical protein